jgi:hypothetical protein
MSVDLSYGGLTGERRDIAEMAEDYLGKSSADPMAGLDLGWFGIGIDEERGGSGGTFADLAPIIEATGARCAATTVGWTTGVLGRLLVETGGRVADEWLPRIADGSATVALPLADPAVAGRTVAAGGGLVLHGAPDPAVLLLPHASRLVLVPADQVDPRPVASVDGSRFLHRVEPSPGSLEADWSVELGGAGAVDRLRVLVAQVAALDAVGATRKALGATLDYALERHQFGRPIGSFQATSTAAPPRSSCSSWPSPERSGPPRTTLRASHWPPRWRAPGPARSSAATRCSCTGRSASAGRAVCTRI